MSSAEDGSCNVYNRDPTRFKEGFSGEKVVRKRNLWLLFQQSKKPIWSRQQRWGRQIPAKLIWIIRMTLGQSSAQVNQSGVYNPKNASRSKRYATAQVIPDSSLYG